MGINTLTVTYFLAIERAPFLKEIFPTFIHYSIFLLIIGIPILVFTGFVHYKKIPGYRSEAEIVTDEHPYTYKLPPGYWLHVVMPYFRLQSQLLLKLTKNEKLTDEEINNMTELQKKMDHLMKGGYVGDKKRIDKFKSDQK